MFSFAACSNQQSEQDASNTSNNDTASALQTPSEDENETAADSTDTEGGNTLVVYYSATGNTENVANYIAAATNGDLFELEPAEPYSDADLNWTDDNSRVVREHDDESLRDIELVSDTVENWDSYDTVSSAIPFGGALPLGRLMASLRQTILQGKQSFLSALLPVRDLAKAANCLQKWQARAIGRKASVFVPAPVKAT